MEGEDMTHKQMLEKKFNQGGTHSSVG